MERLDLPTLGLVLALAIVLLVPFLLQPKREAAPTGARSLVILSPHNEAVRYEFDQAFRHWHRARFG